MAKIGDCTLKYYPQPCLTKLHTGPLFVIDIPKIFYGVTFEYILKDFRQKNQSLKKLVRGK